MTDRLKPANMMPDDAGLPLIRNTFGATTPQEICRLGCAEQNPTATHQYPKKCWVPFFNPN
jgi:hypothetical protein